MSFNPYRHIKHLAFELSNRCVHAEEHTPCPAHVRLAEPTETLKTEHILHVLDTMAEHAPRYSGMVFFHLYNEPLADPRLTELVREVRRRLPSAVVHLTTSGWGLDQRRLDELIQAGVRRVRVSAYDADDLRRIDSLRVPQGVKLWHGKPPKNGWRGTLMPQYLKVYDAKPDHRARTCSQPLYELCIGSNGAVLLCCADWKRTVTFGSLDEMGFDDIVRSDAMARAHASLRRGDMAFEVCKRCPCVHTRGGDKSPYRKR